MKILVLGGKGMAGHVITRYLKKRASNQVMFTSRDETATEGFYLDVLEQAQLEILIEKTSPDLVINAIGLLNEKAERNPQLAFLVNSLLPHQLVKLMDRSHGKVIHISSDCVFSGEKGNYTESDLPDGKSVYARTKAMGELIEPPHLTIRTSIIGPELKPDGIGLFSWFMKQNGEIDGYERVYWNGVTTLELAKAIDHFIDEKVEGLCHLHTPTTISKYRLLHLFKEVFQKEDIIIRPSNHLHLDRTIVNKRKDIDYTVPSYREMLLELKDWMEQNE